jgi:hypothetical protein
LLVVALSLAAIGLFVTSFGQPWWRFKLYAPQYPHGLTLVISLTGLSGDAREIDMLNHYIGMGHLGSAATLERKYAAQAVTCVCLLVFAMTLFARRKVGRLIGVAGALLPVGFIADSFYWLYRFGHQLDPRAPLHIPAFTPQMFGNGGIGQFMTFALPERGFWLAVAGALLLLGMSVVRERACAEPNDASTFVVLFRRAFPRARLTPVKAG